MNSGLMDYRCICFVHIVPFIKAAHEVDALNGNPLYARADKIICKFLNNSCTLMRKLLEKLYIPKFK